MVIWLITMLQMLRVGHVLDSATRRLAADEITHTLPEMELSGEVKQELEHYILHQIEFQN